MVHRKVANHALLAPKAIKRFLSDINDVAGEVVNGIRERYPNGSTVSMDSHVTDMTFNTILRVTLGEEIPELADESAKQSLLKSIAFFFEAARELAHLPPPYDVHHYPMLDGFDSELDNLRELGLKIVTDRRKRKLAGDTGLPLNFSTMIVDVVDPSTGELFGVDDVLVDVLELVQAGVDTTYTSITYMIHELGKRPELQDRLYAEEIDKLPFLNGVVREALRMYPAVPMGGRMAAEDTPLADVFVPKGTPVLLCTKESANTVLNPFAWIPFGAGARSCIGMRLALTEMKAFAAHMVHTFKFESTQDRIPQKGHILVRNSVPLEQLVLLEQRQWPPLPGSKSRPEKFPCGKFPTSLTLLRESFFSTFRQMSPLQLFLHSQIMGLHGWEDLLARGGSGITQRNGQQWELHRKVANRALLAPKAVKHFYTDIENVAAEVVNSIRRLTPDGGKVDLDPFVSHLTFNTILRVTVGREIPELPDEQSKQAFLKSITSFFEAARELAHMPPPFDRSNPLIANLIDEMVQLRELGKQIVTERRRRKLAGDETLPINFSTMIVDAVDPSTGELLSFEDVLVDTVELIFGGVDTTHTGVTYLLHELGKNPDLQERLFAEVSGVFKASQKIGELELDTAAMEKLPLLNATVREAVRLHPSVPLNGRQASEDTVLDGVFVPKGTAVVLCTQACQRSTKYYKDPEHFNPDRFLSAEGTKAHTHHPFSWVTFGAGARSCIGMRLAIAELKSFTSHMVYNFRFRTDKVELPKKGHVFLKNAEALELEVEYRRK
ncbi:hypothetical protein HK102_000174 [Quaeritorhiza haematococci]|nr:hypothetical protein HK102_000174 [Quaeritorhiza haematococci]